jgi:hypothetical protein
MFFYSSYNTIQFKLNFESQIFLRLAGTLLLESIEEEDSSLDFIYFFNSRYGLDFIYFFNSRYSTDNHARAAMAFWSPSRKKIPFLILFIF